MSSRIFIALREEKGLTYSTGAFYPTRALGSHLVFYASSPKKNVQKISQAIPWLIRKWKKEKFTEREVESAIEKVLGDHLRAHETTLSRSWYPGWYESIGWGKEFDNEYRVALKRVTSEDLQKTLRKLPSKQHEVVVAP
jgi:predicted Zn-dependent peptidase